jgi:NAD(P)-dependent dehydrogenase (short-subunit alcohol dehydrogenase family)
MTLAGKTLFISGGSRGIGLAIALRAARDGANIVLIAKTTDPDPRLHGTVFTAAEEIERAGGHAAPVVGEQGVAANCLWPRTTIATDAVANLLGGEQALRHARTPAIVADAAYAILTSERQPITGRTLVDDEVLRERGVTDFNGYAVSGVDADLDGDFFLD